MVPEDAHWYQLDTEGADDMPAHIKASLIKADVNFKRMVKHNQS
jgi:thiamine phosphate synthase YjbQ (UPF0047 family)